MAPGLKPFQLLEINIISAQDLEPVSKKMRTYARAWVNPERKLSSSVDNEGNNNPTWNDKFVFRVDEEFLQGDSSAVMIDIYAANWFRDTIVGTVRVLVGNLIPPPTRSRRNGNNLMGMRFVALQIRRPSGRPQGILNIGVTLLDGSLKSMPLYTQLSSVGYRDLMADPPKIQKLQRHDQNEKNDKNNNHPPPLRPILLRSRSERSERIKFDNYSPNSSIVAVPMPKPGNSVVSISDSVQQPFIKKKGKASSVISGAELREKPKRKGKKGGKASSVVSDSIMSYKNDNKPNFKKNEEKPKKGLNEPVSKVKPLTLAPKMTGGKITVGKGNSILSGSEVGPSPSEVAAVMAERRYPVNDDNHSSVLDGWSMDESVEGLRSKLERWRMELPPLYDHGFSSSSYKSHSTVHHGRRHSDTSSGLFSCFGNICGYECQCICGKPPPRKNRTRYHSPGRSMF